MDSPILRRHWPLFGIAVLFGLYGWAMVVATGSGHDGVIGPRFNALGADWVIFLAAARAFFTGDLAHIYNQAWITEATNSQFAHWLSVTLPFPLFPYPPLYLLLVLPFAKLPVGWSLLLSQAAQFLALAWALKKLAPGKSWLFFLIGAFLCPVASNNVLAGSNAVLVTALIVGGMLAQVPVGHLLDRLNAGRVLVFCGTVQAIGAALLPFAIDNLSVWVLLLLWGGFGNSIYTTVLTMLGRAFTKEELASANTTFTLFWEFGALAGPLLAGAAMWLWDPHGMIVISVLGGLSLVLLGTKALRCA